MVFHKYQESTRTSIFGQVIGDSFKNMFDSLGFAYVFSFCQNYGSLKIIPWETLLKTIGIDNPLGGIPYGALIGQKVSTIRNSRKLRYEQIICF